MDKRKVFTLIFLCFLVTSSLCKGKRNLSSKLAFKIYQKRRLRAGKYTSYKSKYRSEMNFLKKKFRQLLLRFKNRGKKKNKLGKELLCFHISSRVIYFALGDDRRSFCCQSEWERKMRLPIIRVFARGQFYQG